MLDAGSDSNDKYQDMVGGLGTVPFFSDKQEDAAVVNVAACNEEEEEEALPTTAAEELKDQKPPPVPTLIAHDPLPDEAHATVLPTVFAAKDTCSATPAEAEAARRKPRQRASMRSWLRKHVSAPVVADCQEKKPGAGTRISSLYGQEGRVDLSMAAEAVRVATTALTQSAGPSRTVRGASFTSLPSSSKIPHSTSVSSPLPTVLRTSPNERQPLGSRPSAPTAVCPPSPPAGSPNRLSGSGSLKRTSLGRCERQIAVAETLVELVQRSSKSLTARTGSTRTRSPLKAQMHPWSTAGKAMDEVGVAQRKVPTATNTAKPLSIMAQRA